MRVITLGNGDQVPLHNYVAAIITAKNNPTQYYNHGLTCWWPVTGAEIVKEFRDGVHDRINIRGGIVLRDFNINRYTERRRQAASCAWCDGKIPKNVRFNPNVKHHFCCDSCRNCFNAW